MQHLETRARRQDSAAPALRHAALVGLPAAGSVVFFSSCTGLLSSLCACVPNHGKAAGPPQQPIANTAAGRQRRLSTTHTTASSLQEHHLLARDGSTRWKAQHTTCSPTPLTSGLLTCTLAVSAVAKLIHTRYGAISDSTAALNSPRCASVQACSLSTGAASVARAAARSRAARGAPAAALDGLGHLHGGRRGHADQRHVVGQRQVSAVRLRPATPRLDKHGAILGQHTHARKAPEPSHLP